MVKVSLRVVALSLGFLSTSLWGQVFESLYSFPASGSDGAEPNATLTVGPDGSLYGTARLGGQNAAGTIYKVSLDGEVTILNDFETATTGAEPLARLVSNGDGFLYGVTTRNGSVIGSPVGTVYRLDPAGDLSVVFQLKLSSGTFPRNPRSLVAVEPGALHVLGREPGGLWRVPLDQSTSTVTRNFSGTVAEGSFHEKVILGSDGFLYGGSSAGGDNSLGTLFRVAPDGTGFTRLHSCESETGSRPIGAMVEVDGNFYGTMSERGKTNGVIFRLTPAGDYSVLHYLEDLRYPEGDLMLATDGFLYGTAWDLGTGGNGNGGVFRIRPDGTGYKVVYVFENQRTAPTYPNGRKPLGGLVQGADGFLYGTTSQGGTDDKGTVFRLKLKLPLPPVNRPPVAVDDFDISTGAPVTVAVTANDFDPDEDDLTDARNVSIETTPEFGTVAVQQNGSILYTPGMGYPGLDSFTYKVNDRRGGSSIATVTIRNTAPGPLLVAGGYNGLLELQDGTRPQGRLVLTVRPDGKFTGTVFTQKKRLPVRGTFDGKGTAVTSVKIPKQGRAVLFLHFKAGTPNTVQCVLFGQQLLVGEAGPNAESISDQKQSYTVQILANNIDPSMPAGHGYGVVTVKPSGAVSMVGKLGDGSNLSWSSGLTNFNNLSTGIPIFAEPIKNGVFATVVEGNEINGFEGTARWVRAAKAKRPYADGFDGEVDMIIAPFTPPSSTDPVIDIVDGEAALSDGPIANPTQGGFTIDGKKITTGDELRALTINRKNGLFAGTMMVGKKKLTFKGAINQGARDGVGYVSVKGQTGSAELYRLIE